MSSWHGEEQDRQVLASRIQSRGQRSERNSSEGGKKCCDVEDRPHPHPRWPGGGPRVVSRLRLRLRKQCAVLGAQFKCVIQ